MGPGEAVPLSPGTLQGPEDKAENTQKAAEVTEQHDSCLLPWLRDRDGTLPASSRSPNLCCKMGPQCVLQRSSRGCVSCTRPGSHYGRLRVGAAGSCLASSTLEHEGGLGATSSEERPLTAVGPGAGLQLGSALLMEALADGSPL